MDISIITKLVSIILAISLASERLVTFLKTLSPWLSGPEPPAEPPYTSTEKTRRFVVMVLAFLAGWFAAWLMGGKSVLDSLNVGTDAVPLLIPYVIIGLMASGGSAFWAKILEYIKAVNDIKGQYAKQEKLNTNLKMELMPNGVYNASKTSKAFVSESGALAFNDVKSIKFSAAFSGGIGHLNIDINNQQFVLDTDNPEKQIHLKAGAYPFVIFGDVSLGVGGGATLTITAITGSVSSDSPFKFKPGLISPKLYTLSVF